jgi:hypothetical protein
MTTKIDCLAKSFDVQERQSAHRRDACGRTRESAEPESDYNASRKKKAAACCSKQAAAKTERVLR